MALRSVMNPTTRIVVIFLKKLLDICISSI